MLLCFIQTIKTILVNLANVEKKHSSNDRDASLANNVFIAQFMNTALINLLINADLIYYFPILTPLGPNGYNILTGTIRDFNSTWYMNVGAQMILTVLTASISPNVAELVKWPVALIKQRLMTNRVLTQAQMNQLYEGPEVVLSERYGALLSVLFVVMMYSAGMPLLNFFAVVYFSLAYWCDKATLLMISKRPGSIDSTLVGFLQPFLYFKFLLACWIRSVLQPIACNLLFTCISVLLFGHLELLMAHRLSLNFMIMFETLLVIF